MYKQWQPIELDFEVNHTGNPFAVDFRVEFKGPNNIILNVPGFWNGGNTWKVRFTPTRPGNWAYNDKTITVEARSEENDLFKRGPFLKLSNDKEFLTYSDGIEYLWIGDNWATFPQLPLTLDILKTMVEKRLSQGFNTYIARGPGTTVANGVNGFNAVNNVPKALEYWQAQDKFYQYTFSKGMLGCIGLGAHVQWDAISIQTLKDYFRYHLARFGCYGITYHFVQEYDLGNIAGRIEKVKELGAYIADIDPYKRALTVHPSSNTADTNIVNLDSWHSFRMLQSGHFTYMYPKRYWIARDNTKAGKPLIEAETNFEGFSRNGNTIDAKIIRRTFWNAILSGSAGFTYGAQGLYAGIVSKDKPLTTANWGPVLTWEEGLNLPGADHIRIGVELLKKFYWPALKTWRLGRNIRLAAADEGKVSLFYYFPESINDNFGSIPQQFILGNGQARWFDVRTGTMGAKFEWQKNFPKPPDSQDWLLVVDHITRYRR